MFEGLEKICDVYSIETYAYDETPKPVAPKPADFVVVKPKNTIEVSEILRFANDRRIPVFIRGGGTGLSGGAIPTRRGILLSTEKMRGIEIDRRNRVAICQAGVTLEELSRNAEKEGLSFPPRPGAESATVGGMIATNAGGVRALKFGVMRNYVLGMEVVLPDGRILNLGGKTLKSSSGYSLLHLMIGNEGTLGVITKAIIRLLPPLRDMTMLAIPFRMVENALNFAIETSLSFTPLAMEFMDRKAVEIGEAVSGKRWVSKEGVAHILAVLEHREEAEEVADIAYKHEAIDVFMPSQREQRDLLELRGKIYIGLKDKIIEILDICIPPAEIAEFLRMSEELARQYGIELITYGHLGDGNLHQHPLLFNGWERIYPKFRKELLKLAIEFGGVISGEHGIGVLKREELREFYPDQFNLMLEIKKIFDPNFILNPDRIF